MRYVFLDETGTSDSEPFTLVLGVIVQADEQFHLVEERLLELSNQVPPSFRAKHRYLHAKDILGSQFMRDEWPTAARVQLVKEVMSIPRTMRLGLAVGLRRRDTKDARQVYPKTTMSAVQFDHSIAFLMCISQADKWIRLHAGPREVATAIHEDNNTKKYLQDVARGLTREKFELKSDQFFAATNDLIIPREAGMVHISRIRMPIYFAEKRDEPLLQLADICCFGFKRFYGGYAYSEEYMKSLIGSVPERPDFSKVSDVQSIFYSP